MTPVRFISLLSLSILLGLGFLACGKPSAPKPADAADTRAAGPPRDDQSRCDYKDRADREVSESAGPGSEVPNIRRVYALLGEGEERKRVLVCREVDTNLDGVKDVVRTYNERGETITEVADTNFDGRIDTWITFTRGRRAKVEKDKTGNGRPDESLFYAAGKLSRVQLDENDDGRPDVWEIYDDGKLQRRGVDLDHDGHVDRWDRDELALRALEERERRAEAARHQFEDAVRQSQVADAGAPDAHPSEQRDQ